MTFGELQIGDMFIEVLEGDCEFWAFEKAWESTAYDLCAIGDGRLDRDGGNVTLFRVDDPVYKIVR